VTVIIAATLALVLGENLSMTDIKLYDALPYIASAWQAIDAMGGVTDGSGRRS